MTETSLTIPDLVGETGRAEIVAASIRDLQAQKVSLDIAALINDAADTDIAPGTTMTYLARAEQIDRAINRLGEEFPGALALIAESVKD